MKYSRTLRISEEIKKVVSHIIQFEIKDPKLIENFCTITKVETTNDYSYCFIYVSVYGDDESKRTVIKSLEKASGFIRREIGRKVKLRITPMPVFKLDDSGEYVSNINKLINTVIENDSKNINTFDENNYVK